MNTTEDSDRELTARALVLDKAVRLWGWERLSAAVDGNRQAEQEAYLNQCSAIQTSHALRDVVRARHAERR